MALNTRSMDSINKMQVNTYWQWSLFALLQIFNFYQLLNHAMWRDELQIWSIVRESSTLGELFHNMRYDGFPPLWYISLWFLSFISSSPLTMQLFHFSCAFAAQFLVMKRAPVSGAMKLAIVAGYYFSFEYCVISRAYVFGVLLIFILCAFHEWFNERPWAHGGMLGLLANTSVYGAILSLAFVAIDLWPVLRKDKEAGNHLAQSGAAVAAYLTVYGVLFTTAVLFMMQPDDGVFFAEWNLRPDVIDCLMIFVRNLNCLVPVPQPQITFWNSMAAIEAGYWVSIPVSLLVLLAVWFALRSSLHHLVLFFIGFIGIWVFTAIKYFGFIRHGGSAFVLLIACIWLTSASETAVKRVASRASYIATWCILTANLAAWGIASYYHLKYDFSGSREMAMTIERSGKSMYPIVADIDFATSSVASYLNRPIFYTNNRKAQIFIRWNAERIDGGGPADALRLANDLSTNNAGVLLLLNYPLYIPQARFIARTKDSIVADETFHLYEYMR